MRVAGNGLPSTSTVLTASSRPSASTKATASTSWLRRISSLAIRSRMAASWRATAEAMSGSCDMASVRRYAGVTAVSSASRALRAASRTAIMVSGASLSAASEPRSDTSLNCAEPPALSSRRSWITKASPPTAVSMPAPRRAIVRNFIGMRCPIGPSSS